MPSSPSLKKLHELNLQRSGFTRLDVRHCQAVARDWAASAVTEALMSGTLHEWAGMRPERDEMHGRGVLYAVELATVPKTSVVVRRNLHGGLFRSLTGELFVTPTRAPLELSLSVRLEDAGVPTPEVIAYAIYPVTGGFARSDVMTRRLPPGDDVPAVWKGANGDERGRLLAVIGKLLNSLAVAGAWHADLNLKNIYLAGCGNDRIAYLLDVDRVTFPDGVDVAARNFDRLARSARKWRVRWGLDFDEDSLARLAVLAGENL